MSPFENKIKILVAEDNEYNFELIKETLADENIEIFHAACGTEAVDVFLRNKDIHLLLLDIKMPGFSGYEILEKIRAVNPEIVAIAQTAYVISDETESIKKAGFNELLMKPIDPNVLINTIRKLMEE